MVVDSKIIHNADNLGHTQFLGFSEPEAPLAVQLGGNDPELLGEAASLAMNYVGDACVEINLNCGCPSELVAAKNEFGARLMLDPEKVRRRVEGVSTRIPRRASGGSQSLPSRQDLWRCGRDTALIPRRASRGRQSLSAEAQRSRL